MDSIRDQADEWWITDAQLAKGGRKLLGPFATRDLALEVRGYYEQAKRPATFWVDVDAAPVRPPAPGTGKDPR